MAITVHGVDGSMVEARWAELHDLISYQIVSGMAASVATGTRVITVPTGSAVGAGVMLKSDANVTVTLDANVGANPRIDYIVAQIDWSGTGGTGTITFVKGTNAASPVPPALTQTPGTLWQVPLARVTVRPGVGQISGSDLETCRPLRRRSLEYSTTLSTSAVNDTGVDIVRATLDIPDPGWPWRALISGYLDPGSSTVGRARFEAKVNGSINGTSFTGDQNRAPAVIASRSTDVLTGAATVQACITPLNMTANLQISSGRLNVTVLPA